MFRSRFLFLFVFFSLFIFIGDVAGFFIATSGLDLNLTPFIDIRLVENSSWLFFLHGSTYIYELLLMIVVFTVWRASMLTNFRFEEKIGLALFCAGATLNLISRIFFGYVVDWIDIKGFTVFNLADVAVIFGVIITLWYYVVSREDNSINSICPQKLPPAP